MYKLLVTFKMRVILISFSMKDAHHAESVEGNVCCVQIVRGKGRAVGDSSDKEIC